MIIFSSPPSTMIFIMLTTDNLSGWLCPLTNFRKDLRSIAATRLKPVILSFITDQDFSHIAHGFDSKSLRKNRLISWTDEAFDQGALLTQLDLAILLGITDAVVSQYVQEIQADGHFFLQEAIFTISPELLPIKERSLLSIYKVFLLPILP